nr:MAG TPA: Cytidine deaminase [Caudoviricetes sp.]
MGRLTHGGAVDGLIYILESDHCFSPCGFCLQLVYED